MPSSIRTIFRLSVIEHLKHRYPAHIEESYASDPAHEQTLHVPAHVVVIHSSDQVVEQITPASHIPYVMRRGPDLRSSIRICLDSEAGRTLASDIFGTKSTVLRQQVAPGALLSLERHQAQFWCLASYHRSTVMSR